MHIPLPGMEIGPLAKKWGGKRNAWIALATIRPFANFSISFVHIETFAKGVWIGNFLEKLKQFRGDHIDPGGWSPSRGVRFPTNTKGRGIARC